MDKYIKRLDGYIKKIKKVSKKDDMKKIVKKLYYDDNIDDKDFHSLLDTFVAPRLKELGVNMDYDEENNYSSTDKILMELY